MPTSTPTATATSAQPRPRPTSSQEVLERYPLLTAHLICESLGYFSPTAAANAILHHTRDQPFYCEWYIDAAGFNSQQVLEYGKRKLADAFHRRKHHRGYMANITQAKTIVLSELMPRQAHQAQLPPFQSW